MTFPGRKTVGENGWNTAEKTARERAENGRTSLEDGRTSREGPAKKHEVSRKGGVFWTGKVLFVRK